MFGRGKGRGRAFGDAGERERLEAGDEEADPLRDRVDDDGGVAGAGGLEVDADVDERGRLRREAPGGGELVPRLGVGQVQGDGVRALQRVDLCLGEDGAVGGSEGHDAGGGAAVL